MPIYDYHCEKCGQKIEVIQGAHEGVPFCCGHPMKKLPSSFALMRMVDKGGVTRYSKGYKEGYSKEYLKSIGRA